MAAQQYELETTTTIVDEQDLEIVEQTIEKAGLTIEVTGRQELSATTERITYKLTGPKKAFLAWAGKDTSVMDDVTPVTQ